LLSTAVNPATKNFSYEAPENQYIYGFRIDWSVDRDWGIDNLTWGQAINRSTTSSVEEDDTSSTAQSLAAVSDTSIEPTELVDLNQFNEVIVNDAGPAVINLAGSNDSDPVELSLSDILSDGSEGLFTDNGKNQMLIKGDEGDVVQLSDLLSDGSDLGDWVQANDAVTVDGVVYNVYQHSGADAELLVQQGVQTHLV
jgi:hypothetical protein